MRSQTHADKAIVGDELSNVITNLQSAIRSFLSADPEYSKISITTGQSNYLKHLDRKGLQIPLVSIYDTGFESEEIGLGSEFGPLRKQETKSQSGNGKTRDFELPDGAIRPLIAVQVAGEAQPRKEIDDYVIREPRPNDGFTGNTGSRNGTIPKDGSRLTLSFRSAPPQGKDNIVIKYYIVGDIQEIAVKLKVNCQVDVWGENDQECNNIVTSIIKAIMYHNDNLREQGIRFSQPIKGVLIQDEYGKDEDSEITSAVGKRLICSCDTVLRVEPPEQPGRIRDIKITENQDLRR